MTRKDWSLAQRLSWRLAVQTVLGSALVTALVYGMAARHLDERQHEYLAGQRDIVQHLLGEARRDGDLANLRHRLDDYFAGHADLSLEVDSGGGFAYRSPSRVPPNSARTVEFDLGTVPGVEGRLHARLELDLRGDRVLLDRLGASLAVASLFGALAVSLAGWLQVRRGLAPVDQLARQVEALAAPTMHRRLEGSAQARELQPLVEQFNGLLDRTEAAYRQLEAFNADVAHELNTPLATLITSTELALRREGDASALGRMLGDHLEELQRLSSIVRDMLFLAQADRGSAARRTPVPSVAAVAADVIDYHEAALLEAGLRAEIDGDASGELDVPLLKRALSNLLGNAVRYAARGSTVRIEISAGTPREPDAARNASLEIGVANPGPAIDDKHLARIFDRFYRADSARAEAGTHHGLGLSIVAAIARMHGGRAWAHCEGGWTRIGIAIAPHAATRRDGERA